MRARARGDLMKNSDEMSLVVSMCFGFVGVRYAYSIYYIHTMSVHVWNGCGSRVMVVGFCIRRLFGVYVG